MLIVKISVLRENIWVSFISLVPYFALSWARGLDRCIYGHDTSNVYSIALAGNTLIDLAKEKGNI